MKLNPKKLITKGNTEKFFSSNDTLMDTLLGTNDPNDVRADVTITATNKNDSTSKDATLTNDNFIEK